jgi:hypothetical protein
MRGDEVNASQPLVLFMAANLSIGQALVNCNEGYARNNTQAAAPDGQFGFLMAVGFSRLYNLR